MSSLDAATATGADGTQNEQDLGPLAWVLDELRKSLEGVAKSMRRFVRDAEMARQSDLAALDAAALRIARQQLHQAGGALTMVGMESPALLLRAMEAAVQRFVHRPELCSDDAACTIERASFALIEYLECVLAGQRISPVALFPAVPRRAGPGWRRSRAPGRSVAHERARAGPGLAVGVALLPYGAGRARAWTAPCCASSRTPTRMRPQTCGPSQGFAAARAEPQVRMFWTVCAGFFEALAQQALKPDLYAKRVASRDAHAVRHAGQGEHGITERLLQDLLFFCAQAAPEPGRGRHAGTAGRAPELWSAAPPAGGYERPRFGLFDLRCWRRHASTIAAATETWSALAGGDRNKLKPAVDLFSLVCDSLRKLCPESERLAQGIDACAGRHAAQR